MAPNTRKARARGDLIAALAVMALGIAGCAIVQNPMNTLLGKSTINNFEGEFVKTIDVSKISYDGLTAKRIALAEEGKARQQHLAERFVGPIDISRLQDNQRPIYDPEIASFINSIIKQFLAHWPGKTPETRVVFTTSFTGEKSYQAFSTADGTIFISSKAITDADSTDELAFIVAHELSHILLNHFGRIESESEAKKAAEGSTQLLMIAESLAAREQASGRGGRLSGYAILANTGLNMLLDDILVPAWSREQEREADLLGTDLLVKAGFSPRAIGHVMSRLTAR